jgi:arginase
MRVFLFTVPYDSGYKQVRMGRGPGRILEGGLAKSISDHTSAEVQIEQIELEDPFPTEYAVSFAVYRLLARHVREAAEKGGFPLAAGGNCGVSIGVLAGMSGPSNSTEKRHPLGVIWFDAHGDFNTPETTLSGFLDGMPLAVAAGLCWTALAGTIPGFRPLKPGHIIHMGGRDFDPQEKEALQQFGAAVLDAPNLHRQGMKELLLPELEKLGAAASKVHIHLDLDVLDPKGVAPANAFPAPGGLSLEQVRQALRLVKQNFEIVSSTIASYDPDHDPQGKLVEAAASLVNEMLPGG